MWKHILRDQLEVDEPAFWSCVQSGEKPPRGVPEPPAEALPADIVHMLISRVGLNEFDIVGMSRDEAIARLNRYWTENS